MFLFFLFVFLIIIIAVISFLFGKHNESNSEYLFDEDYIKERAELLKHEFNKNPDHLSNVHDAINEGKSLRQGSNDDSDSGSG